MKIFRGSEKIFLADLNLSAKILFNVYLPSERQGIIAFTLYIGQTNIILIPILRAKAL